MYPLYLDVGDSAEVNGGGQLEVSHRSAGDQRLAAPLPAELAVGAQLVHGDVRPHTGRPDLTGPAADGTPLEEAEEALLEHDELGILVGRHCRGSAGKHCAMKTIMSFPTIALICKSHTARPGASSTGALGKQRS